MTISSHREGTERGLDVIERVGEDEINLRAGFARLALQALQRGGLGFGERRPSGVVEGSTTVNREAASALRC